MVIKYHFDGVNPDGKKVGGFLFAEDDVEAREKLKKNGYAILTLDAHSEKKQDGTGLLVFEFRGMNELGKYIQGTIQANDSYEAYKKLRSEYKLELEYLIPSEMSAMEKNELKKKGIDSEMIEMYNIEFKIKTVPGETIQQKKQRVQWLSKKRQEKMNFYRKSIEQVLNDLEVIMSNIEGKVTHDQYRELRDRMDTLSRLRNSNSVEHLDSLIRKLFERLKEFQSMEGFNDKDKGMINKTVSGISSQFDKGMKSVELNLSFINPDKIKKTVKNLQLIENITFTFYWIFFFLFSFCILTLLFLLIKGFFGTDFSHFFFFWKSGTFIFFLSLSILFLCVYYPLLFLSGRWTNKKKLIYLFSSLVVWIIYMIQFPVVFFWT